MGGFHNRLHNPQQHNRKCTKYRREQNQIAQFRILQCPVCYTNRICKLVEGALACAQDDVWQTPEMWLKSDLTGLDELELMWTQIQQELKTKGAAYGND